MTQCDVSIECAHIYADEVVSDQHAESVLIARQETARLAHRGKTVRSVVLIDDIHATARRTTSDEVRRMIAQFGHDVDAVVEESSLIAVTKRVIRRLPRESLYWEPFRRAAKRVLFLATADGAIALGGVNNGRFEPTCALLVAAWHLARLGALPVQGVPTAKLVTSVLEERYRSVEMKALRIIEASRLREFAKGITHIFY